MNQEMLMKRIQEGEYDFPSKVRQQNKFEEKIQS